MIDEEGGYGKPLSRRQRQTRRTLEAYLRAGVVPRYMQRLREIQQEGRRHAARLERVYRDLRERYAGDPAGFARQWTDRAHTWDFRAFNQLVREHNEWYPI